MSAVEKTSLGNVHVWCPATKVPTPEGNAHRTFVVGPSDIVKKLSQSTRPTAGMGLGTGHPDLKPFDTDPNGVAGCLSRGTIEFGSGRSDIDESMPAYLPNLAELARECEPGKSFKMRDIAKVGDTVKLELGAGILAPALTRSSNKGTQGIRWRFHYKAGSGAAKPIDRLYYLTDLLEFTSSKPSLSIEMGDAEATLVVDQQLWIINVPLIGDRDGTPMVIEHAHAWADLLDTPLTGTLDARAADRYERGAESEVKFSHPCRAGGSRYFPPDTDPCFSLMV